MLFRILRRLVAHPQLDRIEVELLGEFVHRAFQRQKTDRLSGGAHRRSDRNVQRRQTMPGQSVVAGIERPRLEGRALVGLLAPQIARKHIVADRKNAAVSIRAEADALNGVRTVRRDMEHLLTRQRRLHWPVKLARSDRRQNGVGVDPKLGAKAAADERADQPDVLDRNVEGPGDRVATLIQHLVRGVKDEVVVLPHGQRGVGLHHGVALQWRSVSHVELHRSRGEGAGEITHRAIGRRPELRVRHARLIQTAAQTEFSRRAVIAHAHEVGSRSGLLESLGDYERDRQAIVQHLRACEHGVGYVMIACALLGRISIGQHQDDAGRSLRRTRIDGLDLSLADRRFHNIAVRSRRPLLHLVGVASAACDLEPSVDAIERLADDALRADIERV